MRERGYYMDIPNCDIVLYEYIINYLNSKNNQIFLIICQR